MTWFYIETAPKDKEIIVWDKKPGREYGPDVHVAIFHSKNNQWEALDDTTDSFDIEPTHWTEKPE